MIDVLHAKKVVPVAVGIVYNQQGLILVSYRKASPFLQSCWEFPGGKIEGSETIFQALRRELREEVGIEVMHADPWMILEHTYVEKTVQLNVWRVDSYEGVARSCEGQAIQWIEKSDLTTLTLLPGNHLILEALLTSNVAED